MNEFKDKTAISTGAASGMGLLFAENFAALGGDVVLCDVNEEALNEKVKATENLVIEAKYKADKNNNGIADDVDPAYTDSDEDMFNRLINIFGSLITIMLMTIFMPFLLIFMI